MTADTEARSASPDRLGAAVTLPPPEQTTLDAPFDQYQRYAITTAIARAMGGAVPPRVLDVGGHHLDFWFRPRRPMAEFLPEAPSITVDLARSRLPGYLCARGDALPFPTGHFDLVCSVDVLEHVPPDARATVIAQVMRVSRRAAVIAAPFRSPVVDRAEAIVSDFIREVCGYEQGQLQEHRAHGWPDLDETAAAFAAAGWHVRVFGYGSVWTWVLMMIDKHGLQAMAGSKRGQIALDRAFNDARFVIDREPPCYRHFVVATLSPDDPVLAFVEATYGAVTPAAFRARPPIDPAHAASTFALLETHAANQRIQARLEPERQHRQLADVDAHRASVVAALEAMTAEATRLEGLLRQVEHSPAYRVLHWVRRLAGRS
ncbi:MAG: class I SAM-dependent methyltransferase [Vicinamibacteraceae bacterium]